MARLVRSCWLLAAATCLAMIAGCSSWNLPALPSASTLGLWPGGDGKPQQPVSVVTIWNDTVLHRPDGRPLRGFAGQLIFYGADADKPVKVDGTLTVYAFDEAGRNPDNVKPDRKFVFTAEQFARHSTRTKVGPAYAVWIPWDEAGGPKKQISLIVRFVPKGGRLLVGEQTRHVLPGPPSSTVSQSGRRGEGGAAVGAEGSQVRLVSYETGVPPTPSATHAAEEGVLHDRTTTIPLPPHFAGVAPLAARGQGISQSGTNPATGLAPAGTRPFSAGASQQINAGASRPTTAIPPPWQAPAMPRPGLFPSPPQPSAHSVRQTLRAPGGAPFQQVHDRAASPPGPAESAHPPASAPAPGSPTGSSSFAPAGSSTPY